MNMIVRRRAVAAGILVLSSGLLATTYAAIPTAGAAGGWIGRETASGLVKGTYVESPNRIGPIANSRGDLYFINEVSEANPELQMLKSSDGGKTWKEVDAAHRPRGRDLESVDVHVSGSRLAIAHQRSGGNVYFHLFRMSNNTSAPDTWQIDSEDVASSATDAEQTVGMAVFPNYSAAQFYGAKRGSGHRIAYRIRSSGNWAWGSEKILDDSVGESFGVTGAMDTRGNYHIIYSSASKNTLYYRTMSSTGSLSSPKVLTTRLASSSKDHYPIVPPVVFSPDGAESLMVGWVNADLRVETAVIPVDGGTITTSIASDQPVARDYGTSRMPVAGLATDGSSAYLVYSDASSLDVFADKWSGDWGGDVELLNGVTAHWIRATARTRPSSQGGGNVLGFVWDMGSNGHAGDSRYSEFALN